METLFFLFPLYSVMSLVQEFFFPPYPATADADLFKFFQLNRVPQKKKKKKSGTGVNSSNVDKRTRLIPCRCVCDLCEGNTVLPSLERKSTLHTGESSMNYEQKNTSDPVQLVLTACLVFQRSEKRQHRDTSFSLSGGTVGMQNHRGVC